MHFLITAGPTREAIDPVRFLTNRSSGRMGYGLARAAVDAGHRVTLISGPVALTPPIDAALMFHRVESAQDMWDAARTHTIEDRPDVAIHAAAVADYRPSIVSPHKIKKDADTLTLELVRTRDVLGSMREDFGYQGFLVGFAAETENLIPNAQAKLERKACDLVICNDVSRKDTGFDTEENEVILCFPSGETELLPKQTKDALAREIIRRIALLATHKTSL